MRQNEILIDFDNQSINNQFSIIILYVKINSCEGMKFSITNK